MEIETIPYLCLYLFDCICFHFVYNWVSYNAPTLLLSKKKDVHLLFFCFLFLSAALNGGDVEISERSKKDKVRCSSNEDGEMMGGGSEGEEELGFPSNSSRKRFKLNGKVGHALSRAKKKKK